MKTLSCGEMMPGCDARFAGATEDEVLTQAGRHAAEDHGLTVTPEFVETVRGFIREEAPVGVASD